MRIGSTRLLSASFLKYCCALESPNTRGSTASRCEGLGRMHMCMLRWLSRSKRSNSTPRWYLTSPVFPHSLEPKPETPWNSLSICCMGLCMTLTRTLSLPLWAIPITTDSMPSMAALLVMAFIPTMRVSHPSSPNLRVVANLLAQKFSKSWDLAIRVKIFFRLSRLNWYCLSVSSFCRIKLQTLVSVMCMYSIPRLPQYVSLRRFTSSLRGLGGESGDRKPCIPGTRVSYTRSMSAAVNPYCSGDRRSGRWAALAVQ